MSIKDVLVFLDESSPSEGRLRLAANIAQGHQACLSAVFVRNSQAVGSPSDPGAPWLGLVAGPQLPGAIATTQSAILADIAEQRFRDCLGSPKAIGDWYPLDHTNTAELIALARAADLIIIGQRNLNTRPAPAWRPEEIVVSCGRPVLMVPYVGSYARVGRRVLVAWDGSREAVRHSTMLCR